MKAGLVQLSLKASTSSSVTDIRDAMLEAHIEMVQNAAKQGVQVISFQELFNQPYFCATEDKKWFAAAELVPGGSTVEALQPLAKKYEMVIVAPVYERVDTRLFNTAAVIDADGKYLGKYQKNHIPKINGVGNEVYYFEPSEIGYPVFQTAYCKLGVYICYDRHFPEGWRALALNGAQYVVNPSATVEGLSQHIWDVEQRAAAVANQFFVGAINRVGIEEPWNTGHFYGSSYFVDPRGNIIAKASSDSDELLIADLDLEMIMEERKRWGFYEMRQPRTYSRLVQQ